SRMRGPGKGWRVVREVEGRLVTREKVRPERAQAAARRLREAGIRFAVTSGRPPKGMAMLIEPLAIETPIAGFNGGLFVRPDLSLLACRTPPPRSAARPHRPL